MEPLIFLQTHIDYYQSFDSLPTIEIFGLDRNSMPVQAHIHNFLPYLYLENFNNIQPIELQVNFNSMYKKAKILKIIEKERQSIYGYSSERKKFLKVFFNTTSLANAKFFIESGLTINNKKYNFKVYESNLNFIMRFMVDKQINGMSYIQINKYEIISEGNLLVIKVEHEDVSCLEQKGEFMKLPKMKILSFDIECIGTNDSFPNAKNDPVIQIGNTFSYSNELTNIKTIFCLKECAVIPDATVYSFDDERDLLNAWHKYVLELDPDLITGYNIKSFDFPYLVERANFHKLKHFKILGRTKKEMSIKEQFFSSRQMGSSKNMDVEIPGRLIFDMLNIIKRDFNLRSYTLNSVSVHFLSEQKEDVPYSSMRALQEGNKETRKRIAVYCLRDTYLPLRLFFKLNVLANYTEMARVTGVPVEYLSSRGQAIKVLSQIFRNAAKENYVIPTIDVVNENISYEGGFVMDPIKGYYVNPVSVLDFSSLYPSIMIVNNLCYTTLIDKREYIKIKENAENNDVYSSSLEGYNIFSNSDNKIEGEILQNNSTEDLKVTKKPNEEKPINYNEITNNNIERELSLDDITVTPTGNYFVKASKKPGLLPRILMSLISERKKAKQDLAQTNDPELKASLNARQLALKISANSVYGFTGAPTGKLPCLEISQSVTGFGREMIGKTKNLIEKEFNKANGFSHNTKVIYGDTDSVMINFYESDIKLVFEMSKKISKFVSDQFIKPISLEFEKVYYPYLLMNKKRYAGLVYTKVDKPDKIDTKGIETVRRDNCEMVRNVIETCLDLILYKKDVEGAKKFVINTVRDLYLNKIDLSQLVISKALTKSGEQYASKQAHVELVEKLKKRDEGSAPVLGDRVGYIIIKGAKGSAAYERSEDPVYVLDNGLPIDIDYYVENQLSKPVFRLFEPIMDDVTKLVRGEHTRIKKSNVTISGPLSGFVKKQVVCLNCKAVGKILCDNCSVDWIEHFITLQNELNEKEILYSKCWTECQRCQGSIIDEVLCVNRVCPIFFMRSKVKIDMKDVKSKFDMLKELQW